VTVHDTATDGTAPFNANDAAKAAHATPFKRPENGLFQPGSGFRAFFFAETGDTDATSPENDDAGGWGAIMKLTQASPTASTGTLTMFFKADEATSSFDNCAWLSKDQITFVQDAGDLLHGQANALDSAFAFDANADYSNTSNKPLRWLAEGRDPSATLDSSLGGEENEITGSTVSDGDPSTNGILGAKAPNLGNPEWRFFWTQQHGDNTTWEVTVSSGGDRHGDGQGDNDQGDD
jgi:secreted PhoX family phosphatase